MKLFKRKPKPKWHTIEVLHGEWDIVNDFGKEIRQCTFEIQASESEGYRIQCYGHCPKSHTMYAEAIERLNVYRNAGRMQVNTWEKIFQAYRFELSTGSKESLEEFLEKNFEVPKEK